MVSFTSRQLYPQGKSPWYALDRRLGGPQSRSGRGGLQKIPSCRQESNPRTPIVQPVVQRCTDWTITAERNEWSYISTPQYAFMAWCLVKKHFTVLSIKTASCNCMTYQRSGKDSVSVTRTIADEYQPERSIHIPPEDSLRDQCVQMRPGWSFFRHKSTGPFHSLLKDLVHGSL
jgi:hypothetical protein